MRAEAREGVGGCVCVGAEGGGSGQVYEVGRWGGVRREGYKGVTLSSSVRLLTIVHSFHDGNGVSYPLLLLHLVVRVGSLGLPTR